MPTTSSLTISVSPCPGGPSALRPRWWQSYDQACRRHAKWGSVMEQPQEETPEAREEEKEEVAPGDGAPELNGGPEHMLPSSSCTGMGESEGLGGRAGGGFRFL